MSLMFLDSQLNLPAFSNDTQLREFTDHSTLDPIQPPLKLSLRAALSQRRAFWGASSSDQAAEPPQVGVMAEP